MISSYVVKIVLRRVPMPKKVHEGILNNKTDLFLDRRKKLSFGKQKNSAEDSYEGMTNLFPFAFFERMIDFSKFRWRTINSEILDSQLKYMQPNTFFKR